MAPALLAESLCLVTEKRMERPRLFPSNTPNNPPTPPDEIADQFVTEKLWDDVRPISADDSKVIAVIGVGYVGVHLVELFALKYKVIAFDVSAKRLETLQEKFSKYPAIFSTTDPRHLKESTHFLVSVPTCVRPDRSIDLTHIKAAIKTVSEHARPGAVIVIESSVAVGMTRQLLTPLVQLKGLKAGMSPERVDPGRTEPPAAKIPKIISGLEDIAPGSLSAIHEVYSNVFDEVVQVSKPEVAEMMKLYENCQRMMCIAYANEMADACIPHGISPYEVCNAAATKPFGYMPFSPGLGVGGPCIPCNPYYLLMNNSFPLLEAATEKMWQRPAMVAERLISRLKKSVNRPRVLVVGVGFKAGQSLTTNAPGISLIQALQLTNEVDVQFVDPLVQQEEVPYVRKLDERTEWTKVHIELHFDVVVVAIKQTGLDLEILSGVNIEVERFVQD